MALSIEKTRRAAVALVLATAMAVSASAGTPGRPHGTELRVYIADKEKKLVDPGDVQVTIRIDRPGGPPPKTLETDLSTPSKGDKRFGIGHGGEVVESGGFFVEFVVYNPHDPSGKGARAEDDGTPFFRTEIDVKTMPEFQAVVIFKVKGETRNAKGFEYPPLLPATFKEAVVKLDGMIGKLEGVVKAKDHEATHGLEKRVSRLCEGIPGLAPADSRGAIQTTCKGLSALFKDLDTAVHSGDAEAPAAVIEKYKAAIGELKKQVK